jgi:hypothetical protein
MFPLYTCRIPPSLPGRCLASRAGLSLLLSLLLAVSMSARAQLPVGGFLGEEPVEDAVEEQIEEQVEEEVEEGVEEEVVDAVEDAVEEAVEEEVADSVEQATEQNIQEEIEDNIEEAIEQTVDASVEDSIDDAVAEAVEVRIEEAVEERLVVGVSGGILEAVEEQVEEAVAGTVEDAVESGIEEDIESGVEAAVEEAVEAEVEAAVVADVEDYVESSVEDAVAQSVEEDIEESVAQAVEEGIDESIDDSIETSIETSIEASVETAVEESVEATVEENVASAVEESVEDAVEENVAASVDAAVESSVEDSVEDAVEESVEAVVEVAIEDDVEGRLVAAIEERLDTEIDEIVEDLESDLEVDESRILKEQWLVMAEPAVFRELSQKGYLFDTVTELPGLGLRLAEVAAPSTFDISEVRDGVFDIVGKDRAEVDLNHIYTAGVPEAAQGSGLLPRAAMPFPADVDDMALRVGMIDSLVDVNHPALAASRIESRSFASRGAEAPRFHGTAIASIIAGNAPDYRGLAPSAELYAASVFEIDERRGEIASTVSLIRALDWLISSDVSVVNVSLAGPPNRLLEKALEKAAAQDVVVMAAAGNGGPMARPMYPAAYESVVAVTAVDAARNVFRLANRGDYLALAAPGVDLRHASPDGGYTASSGTSFAVPFAVTAAARLRYTQPGSDIIAMLLDSATDIGPPGRDQIYGYGLLTLGSL